MDNKETTQEKFDGLIARWREDTKFMSSSTEIYANENYQAIIAMGKEVVPMLLKELENDPDHLFVPLYAITGEDPVKKQHYGNIRKMADDWIEWGKEHDM